jgi:hypothetical protein
VPHGILQVFIIIFKENVFQKPELFPTQVSLYPKQSTLVLSVHFPTPPEPSGLGPRPYITCVTV